MSLQSIEVRVYPRTSLFVGGYAEARGASDGDTARDGRSLLVPGSTLKGALRESAWRLVRALPADSSARQRGEELCCELFGLGDEPQESAAASTEGRGGHRKEHKVQPGRLRVGILRPEEPDLPEAVARHHVSIQRATRQAARGLLFQNRVTPAIPELAFVGEIVVQGHLSEAHRQLLETAAGITDQLGGGRGRGVGMVHLELGPATPVFPHRPRELSWLKSLGAEERGSLTLELKALEPLQLGAVKSRDNLALCQDYLDGSLARGAAAAALVAWHGLEASVLEEVLGGERPAEFGDGHPGALSAIAAPMTLYQPKEGCVAEQATKGGLQDLAIASLLGLPEPPPQHERVGGTVLRNTSGWEEASLRKRVITRAERDHRSGRAADRKLFSMEILDPLPKPDGDNGAGSPLRFFVPVRGTARQLQAVVEAAGSGLLVGGARSRGLGRLELVGVHREALRHELEDRHQEWIRTLREIAEVLVAEPSGQAQHPKPLLERPESTGVLLALGPVAMHPERLARALSARGLEILGGGGRRQLRGGWNRRAGLPRRLEEVYLPGAVWLVQRSDGRSALEELGKLEAEGLGPGRSDGWGRLVACHPIHVECAWAPLSKDSQKEKRA